MNELVELGCFQFTRALGKGRRPGAGDEIEKRRIGVSEVLQTLTLPAPSRRGELARNFALPVGESGVERQNFA